jgi:hypothetical protein
VWRTFWRGDRQCFRRMRHFCTRANRFGRVLLCFITLSSTFSSGAACGEQAPSSIAHALLGAIVSQHLVNANTGDIPKVLRILVAKTKFAKRININEPPNDQSVNFYLLPPHLGDLPTLPPIIWQSQILGNCVFIGISNAIVCDPDFLDSFLESRGIYTDVSLQVLPAMRRADQSAFLAWVLGHELGHVMTDDKGAHFGEANAIDCEKEAITLQQRRETDADLYAARQIQRNRHIAVDLENMLLSLINREVIEKVGAPRSYGVGINFDYSSGQMIRYFANQDHPEFIIRATRTLQQLSVGTKDPALQGLVSSFSRHLVQGQ